MDLLSSLPWQGFGWGGIIFVGLILIMRGDLVPRKFHEERVAAIREDRDNWRNACKELLAQNSKLLSVGDLTVNAMRAIEAKAEAPSDRDEHS